MRQNSYHETFQNNRLAVLVGVQVPGKGLSRSKRALAGVAFRWWIQVARFDVAYDIPLCSASTCAQLTYQDYTCWQVAGNCWLAPTYFLPQVCLASGSRKRQKYGW